MDSSRASMDSDVESRVDSIRCVSLGVVVENLLSGSLLHGRLNGHPDQKPSVLTFVIIPIRVYGAGFS
jgi:hypothetical protein